MSFTLCTSGAIIIKAGANVNSTAATSGAIVQQFCDEAEGVVCIATRYDWITNYATLSSFAKTCLADATACLAGVSLINYDMSGYTNRGEAEDMINVLYDRANYNLQILQKYKRPEEEK